MADKPATVGTSFVDAPEAPEYFASLISGVGFDGPNVRMAFASDRANHENGSVNRVVNCRVVMSVASARQMIEFLSGFLAGAELNATQKPPEQPMQ